MAKKKAKKRKKSKPQPWFWSSLDSDQRRTLLLRFGVVVLVISTVVVAGLAMERLEEHVNDSLVQKQPAPSVFVADVPEQLIGTADVEVQRVAEPLLQVPWTDERICKEMALRVADIGWVQEVLAVRRTSVGQFVVQCRYRVPFAMVQSGQGFYLVDSQGFRLPGSYRYDSNWLLVQGVTSPAPEIGKLWEGEDVQAGLDVVGLMLDQPFTDQITGVLVGNYEGRVNRRRCHIRLATDRAGSFVCWGSAPGLELEENTIDQKLSLMREVYSTTGRVDAGESGVDISTFPGRYIVGRK